MQVLADKIRQGLKSSSGTSHGYNGVHLSLQSSAKGSKGSVGVGREAVVGRAGSTSMP